MEVKERIIDRNIRYWKSNLIDVSKKNRMIAFKADKKKVVKLSSLIMNGLEDWIESDMWLNIENHADEYDLENKKAYDELDKVLTKMRRTRNTAMSEQGVNTLYLTMGLLDWGTSKVIDDRLLSPILMVPVELKDCPHEIKPFESAVVLNPCLAVKFKKELGIDLPEFKEGQKIEGYFEEFKAVLNEYQDFYVTEGIYLGLYNFSNIAIYHELDQYGELIKEHPITKNILSQNQIYSAEEIERLESKNEDPEGSYQILDADSSQREAIASAQKGVSFVIQGPPGTGKSQTIANIIADCLGQGKTVLFVSEKMAALDVVYKRLKQVGLADFCLELHSNKANKKEVIFELHKQIYNTYHAKMYSEEDYFKYDELTHELDEYMEAIHRVYKPLNKTAYWLHGRLSQLNDIPLIELEENEVQELDTKTFTSLMRYAEQLEGIRDEFSDFKTTLWNDLVLDHSDDFDRLVGDSNHWIQVFKQADEIKRDFEQKFKIKIENLNQLNVLVDTCLEASRDIRFVKEWRNFSTNELIERMEFGKRSQLAVNELKQELEERYVLTGLRDDSLANIDRLLSDFDHISRQLRRGIYSKTDIGHWIETAKKGSSMINKAEELWEQIYGDRLSNPTFNIQHLKETQMLLKLLSDFKPIPEDWQEMSKDQFQQYGEQLLKDGDQHQMWNEIYANFTKYFNIDALKVNTKSQDYDLKNDYGKYYYLNRNYLLSDLDQIKMIIQQLLELRAFTNEFFSHKKLKTMNDIRNIMDIIHNVTKVDFFPVEWAEESVYKMTKRRLERFKKIVVEARDLLAEILEDFEKDILNLDVVPLFARFNGEYLSTMRNFNKKYRMDVRMIRMHAKKKDKFSYDEAHKAISLLKQYHDKMIQLEEIENEDKGVFNYLCDGLETDFRRIEANFESTDLILEQISQTGMHASDAKLLLQDKGNIEKVNRFKVCVEALNKGWRKHQRLFSVNTVNLNQKDLNQLDLMINQEIAKAKKWLSPVQEILRFDLSKGKLDFSLFCSLIIEKDQLLEFMEKELSFKELYGSDYQGLETDWHLLKENVQWFSKVQTSLTMLGLETTQVLNSDLPSRVQKGDLASALQTYGTACNFLWENLTRLSILCDIEAASQVDLEIMKRSLLSIEGYLTQWKPVVEHLSQYRSSNFTSSYHVHHDLEVIARYLKMIKEYEAEAPKLKAMFGAYYDGLFTNWDEIARNVMFFEEIKRRLSSVQLELSDALYSQLTTKEDRMSMADFEGYQEILEVVEKSIQKYRGLFTNVKIIEKYRELCLTDLVNYFEELYLQSQKISGLKYYLQQKQNFNQFGYEELFDKLIDQAKDGISLMDYTEKSLYLSFLNFVYENHHILKNFTPSHYELTIQNFKKLDKEIPGLNAGQLREKLYDMRKTKLKDYNLSKDKSLIEYENNKVKRHLPIRQLLAQTSELVMSLKPCMLMSPVTVSEFLTMDKFHFDLIVFDEASQICPEDVISTMLRGKNVVIAGDSHQLPPTKFFKESAAGDEEEFDYADDHDYESILDLCTTLLPQKTLRWHYRSKSESLISFSNAKLYKNFLYTFPNPKKSDDFGVRFEHVSDGVYDRNVTRTNLKEAERVVELVIDHFKNHPERSLGVITLSQAQMDLILNKIEEMRAEYPQFESYFENHEESFFVKNLENAQGDERDTIILSICYGKDQNGVLRYQFGPLNNEGGERRLNVAITRAKLQLHVVSSITGEEIDLSRSKSRGVHFLKEYLTFAEDANRNDNDSFELNEIFESPLEADIVHELRQLGYKTQMNIGCSDYRISIGVVNPANEDEFVLGIECDGQMYANTASARDRIRIRHEVLENMGWKIIHVPSQEWFMDKNTVMDKILSVLPKI